MRLQDKVILVTGSTTGIGEAIAQRAWEEGARVVVHGRNSARGMTLASRWKGRAIFVSGDLANLETPKQLIESTLTTFGRLDALVNNAAITERSNLLSTDATLFDHVMAINVRAPLLLIQAARPYLKDSRGCVLNIGSTNAYGGENNLLAYSISKGALTTLSRNLADACCYEGIRINHLNLGWVLTTNEYQYKLDDGLPPDWPEKLPYQLAPSGRLIAPAEIAAAAVYWLSDESRPINGSVIDLEQYPFVGRNPTKWVGK